MKFHKLIIIILILVIFAVSIKFFNLSKIVSTKVEKTTLQERLVTIGTVSYKVTPKNINFASRKWEFEIILEIHTGSLDQDLTTIISITDNKGNKYQATKWLGDPPGGHHREGILEFSPITPYPTYIELKIQETNVTEKIIRWNI